MSCGHGCHQGRHCTCAAQAPATPLITVNSDGSSSADEICVDDTGYLLVRGILLVYGLIALGIWIFT